MDDAMDDSCEPRPEPARPWLDRCVTNQPAWLTPWHSPNDRYQGTINLVKEVNPQQAYHIVQAKQACGEGWGFVCFANVLPRLGEGVYLSPNPDNAERVAIKRLNKQRVDAALRTGPHDHDPYKEIHHMQELGDNVHVLGYIEVLQDDENIYIVMPYCTKVSLEEILLPPPENQEQELPKDQARVRLVFQQILENLTYLRRHGICRRDLSIDSCMIYRGRAVFIDFADSVPLPPEGSDVLWPDTSGRIHPHEPQDRTAIFNNYTLHGIVLTYNTIGVEGATALVDALTQNSTQQTALTELYDTIRNGSEHIGLFGRELGDKDAKRIAKALMDPITMVQKLWFAKTRIDYVDARVVAYAYALKQNSTPKQLALRSINIGDEYVTVLAHALTHNSTLQILYLDENGIGNEGATALADALKINSTLQELYLDENAIGNEGAMALADALNINSTLQQLRLTNNNISQALLRQIDILLHRENRQKRHLLQGGNHDPPESFHAASPPQVAALLAASSNATTPPPQVAETKKVKASDHADLTRMDLAKRATIHQVKPTDVFRVPDALEDSFDWNQQFPLKSGHTLDVAFGWDHQNVKPAPRPPLPPKDVIKAVLANTEFLHVLKRLETYFKDQSIQAILCNSPPSLELQTLDLIELAITFWEAPDDKFCVDIQKCRGDDFKFRNIMDGILDVIRGVDKPRAIGQNPGVLNYENIRKLNLFLQRVAPQKRLTESRNPREDKFVVVHTQLVSRAYSVRASGLDGLIHATDMRCTMATPAFEAALVVLSGKSPFAQTSEAFDQKCRDIQDVLIQILVRREEFSDDEALKSFKEKDEFRESQHPSSVASGLDVQGFTEWTTMSSVHKVLTVLSNSLDVLTYHEEDTPNTRELVSSFLSRCSDVATKRLASTLASLIRDGCHQCLAIAYLACRVLRLLSVLYTPLETEIRADTWIRDCVETAFQTGHVCHSLLERESLLIRDGMMA